MTLQSVQSPSICCNICLDEDPKEVLIWHEKSSSGQRAHASCTYCAAMVCFKALQTTSKEGGDLFCPDCRLSLKIESPHLVKRDIFFQSYKVSFVFFFYKMMIEPLCSILGQIILHGPLLWHRQKFCDSIVEQAKLDAKSQLQRLHLCHLEMTSISGAVCLGAIFLLSFKKIIKDFASPNAKIMHSCALIGQISFYALTHFLMYSRDQKVLVEQELSSLHKMCIYPELSKSLTPSHFSGLVSTVAIPVIFNFLLYFTKDRAFFDSAEGIQKALSEKKIWVVVSTKA